MLMLWGVVLFCAMKHQGKFLQKDTFDSGHQWRHSLQDGIITYNPNAPAEKNNDFHEDIRICMGVMVW